MSRLHGIRREIHHLRCDDANLALHSWRPARSDGAIFYFHGLQSHAGWLWEAGRRFAANGVAFYALDRRGCGISDGLRNEIGPVSQSMSDLIAAVGAVRSDIGQNAPLTMFGHCLGGSFLAALLHEPRFDIRVDAVVFCSAWLGRMHATLSPEARERLANDAGSRLWDAGLKASDFTDDERYRSFIELDPLATRQITALSRANLLRLEEQYVGRAFSGDQPQLYISGDVDPVIDLASARGTFRALAPRSGRIVSLPSDKHYLFFTKTRDSLIDWVSHISTHPEAVLDAA